MIIPKIVSQLEVVDDELQDLDNDAEENTTGTKPQDPNEQEESSQDADVDSVPQDDLEDELEPWVDYMVRATHKKMTC